MAQAFEYLVCQTQWGYVTFVNGEWQGSIDYRSTDPDVAYKSCPQVWEYLNRAGRDGWELVSAVTLVSTHSEGSSQATNQLFLKRGYS
jgi:hypothetical protein